GRRRRTSEAIWCAIILRTSTGRLCAAHSVHCSLSNRALSTAWLTTQNSDALGSHQSRGCAAALAAAAAPEADAAKAPAAKTAANRRRTDFQCAGAARPLQGGDRPLSSTVTPVQG